MAPSSGLGSLEVLENWIVRLAWPVHPSQGDFLGPHSLHLVQESIGSKESEPKPNCRQDPGASACSPSLSWEPPAVKAAGREAVPSIPAGTGECE